MLSNKRQGLSKAERLNLKRSIDPLFRSANSFIAYPLRVVYLMDQMPQECRGQILVSVSKRYHKHATARNRIKRLIKESYRLQKQPWLSILEDKTLQARIAFIYVSREVLPYYQISKAMTKSLQRLIHHVQEHS